jgi:Flp pilus assembly protein TadG
MTKMLRKERGVTLVEAALTILLFFTLIFSILEFGRAYNVYQLATNAAREGSRFSVAPFPGTSTLPTAGDVETHVRDFLASANVSGASVVVNQIANGTNVNGIVLVSTEVDVQAPYTFIFFPFGTIQMNAKAVMRNEND